MTFRWQTPAWGTPLDRADRVELLHLPGQGIVPEDDWPAGFWKHVSDRRMLSGANAREVIDLFRQLEPGISARCHMPPWGLALYEGEVLLFTVTLSYLCHNAYVYTSEGKDLRAFDPSGANGARLRQILREHLGLDEPAT